MRPLVFVEAVPPRPLASCIRTASCSSERSPSRPKTPPATSSSPIFSCAAEYSGNFTAARSRECFSMCLGIGRRLHIRTPPGTRRMMNYNERAVGTRHRAGNNDCVVVGKYFEHFEIEDGGGRVTHLSRHPHPLAHSARIRAIAHPPALAEVLL